MLKKIRIIIGCVFLLLLFQSINISYAFEQDKQYIVEFVSDFELLGGQQDALSLNVLSESELQKCLDAGIVEWYEEDFEVELLECNTTADSVKWDLSHIKAQKAKNLLCEGQEITVGIIDSGVMNHPAIKDNINCGYNYIDHTNDVTDNIGHGTFVAGLIAANDNASEITGVACETELVPLKCFDTGAKTTVSMICDAIRDAVDTYSCDIINMSLGLTLNSKTLENYIKYATNSGVIIVAAVGNKGTDALYYPAAYNNVIGVGSINQNYSKSDFSQYNSSVDFVAPGENVWSTTNNGLYGQNSGTSFSTPLVVGMIAAMMNIDQTLTHDEIISYISETATIHSSWVDDNPKYERNDYFGYGLINIECCLDLMLKDHTYFISPIDFDTEGSQVAIVNNSNSVFSGYCMWGEYSNSCMLNMSWSYVCIPPGQYTVISGKFIKNIVKCFLWQSIDNISAIADYREREEN